MRSEEASVDHAEDASTTWQDWQSTPGRLPGYEMHCVEVAFMRLGFVVLQCRSPRFLYQLLTIKFYLLIPFVIVRANKAMKMELS